MQILTQGKSLIDKQRCLSKKEVQGNSLGGRLLEKCESIVLKLLHIKKSLKRGLMNEKRISIVFVGLFFIFAVLTTSAQSIYGAIFTSLEDGTGVNINLYDDKCDAFLNGGPPPHASCDQSGLSDGCYVFQVTAPPGGGQNETLLSQDSITKRFVKVSGGVFVQDDGTCAAAASQLNDCGPCADALGICDPTGKVVNPSGNGDTGHDAGHGKCEASIPGNISARLMPFCDTPNHGGVYKVYATKVERYDNNCSGVFGFIHRYSNTDNFRVKPSVQPPPELQGEIDVLKFCDANANGFLDPAELIFGLSGWQMNFNPDPENCNGQTDANGLLGCSDLVANTYTVTETVEDDFNHTATCVDGFCGYCSTTITTLCNSNGECPAGETCEPNPVNPASITITGGDTHNVDFGNVGLSEINGRKFNDTNANGINDTEPGIAGIIVLLSGTAANGASVDECTVTGTDGSYSFSDLLPGSYTVSEVKPAETISTTPTWCEISLQVDGATCEGATAGCSFGNVCLGAGGGRTLGFWSNKNGQAFFGSDDLALMVSLNLRNANGTDFNPGNYTQFRTWLLNANATNMAYMLSAQLSAMELNVLNGFVSSSAMVYAPNCGNFVTIGNLMNASNVELGLHGLTLAGSPYRSYQECLKNSLDNANNNKNFVVTCPADFGATCP